MSRGEMVLILETHLHQVWDQRHWDAAVKANNPGEQYAKIKEEIETLKRDEERLEKLSPDERQWYRS